MYRAAFRCSYIGLFLLVLTACSNPPVTLLPLADDAVILAFGDSLTYGTGADIDNQSYPAVLAQLTSQTVINAGVPGEVSQQGLVRLPALLDEVNPDLVILCHGGNDLIRRMDKRKLKSNLEQMIVSIQNSGAQVVLVAVPAFGLTLRAPDLYLELADKYQLVIQADIIPKLERRPKFKADQVHPNAEGYTLLAESIFSLLQRSHALEIN